jgi:prepilin-type processing-associated H-X9-DG protein
MEQNAMFNELNAACQWEASLPSYPTITGAGDFETATTVLAAGMALPWTWAYADPSIHGKQAHPGGEFFPALGCPSDGEAKKTEGATNPCSYVGCNGDSYIGGINWNEQGREMAARGVIKPWQDYAINHEKGGESEGLHGESRLELITDGTSNTMIVSETAVGTPGGDRNAKRGVVMNDNSALPNLEGDGSPSDCLVVRGPGNTIKEDYVVLNAAKGSRWLDSHTYFSIYKAVLPPNSPSCSSSTNADEDVYLMGSGGEWPNGLSASSYHTGGVNVCMADGAVRFVSDSVDVGDPTLRLGWIYTNGGTDFSGYLNNSGRGCLWMGPSTYGVWGALATPAHGESKSL